MWQIEPQWTIIEQGIIELKTTHIRIIRDDSRAAPFVVTWKGQHQGVSGTLEMAKDFAMSLLDELLETGEDP